jgi:hypothetical protein
MTVTLLDGFKDFIPAPTIPTGGLRNHETFVSKLSKAPVEWRDAHVVHVVGIYLRRNRPYENVRSAVADDDRARRNALPVR